MSEINVTPFVDVMLVLLIIFMVTAPLLTAGVPIELPQARGKQLEAPKEPLTISVQANGDVFVGETKVAIDELADAQCAVRTIPVDVVQRLAGVEPGIEADADAQLAELL